MRFLDFIFKRKDPTLIRQLGLSEFWEKLSEDDIQKFKYFSEKVLSDNKISLNDFEEKTQIVFRSMASIEDVDTQTAFIIRSASDFLADVAEIAVLEKDLEFAEKLLIEGINKGSNIFDLHYCYTKILDLYYGNMENARCEKLCKDYCVKDIEIFEEIRKNSYNEYLTIAKRSYKAALMSKGDYDTLINKIKNHLVLPIIPAFKMLTEIYFKEKNYLEALLTTEKALLYNMDINEKEYFNEMLNQAKEYLYVLQKEKAELISKEEENQEKKVDNCVEELKVEDNSTVMIEEKKEIKENLQESVSVVHREIDVPDISSKSYQNILKIKKEIEDGNFFEKNGVEKGRERLLKIINMWERGALEGIDISLIVIKMASLYYNEENDEKAIKLIFSYIKLKEKNGENGTEAAELRRLKRGIENKTLRRDYVFSGSENEEYKSLLAVANEEYKTGNYDKAAYTAKKAKESADINNIVPNITELLKLPMYLQKSKRYEESWAIYDILLKERSSDGNCFIDISKIYDKMRIQLQSEKKFEKAIVYSLLSFIFEYKEYKKKADNKRLEELLNRIDEIYQFSLKRCKLENKESDIKNYIKNYIDNFDKLTDIDYTILSKDIFKILNYSEPSDILKVDDMI